MSEGLGNVGVVGDEAAALDEDAQSRPEFMEVGGGNHPADGVQVFVCEVDAFGVYFKSKKHTARVADCGFGGIQLPMFFFAQGQVVRPA